MIELIAIESKIHEISECLLDDILNGNLSDALKDKQSLLTGHLGVVIFLNRYIHDFPDDKKEKVISEYTNNYFDSLSDGVNQFSYCNGLAGILFGLRYLNNSGLSEIDFSELRLAYNDLLYRFVDHSFIQQNFDFLHGALGGINYNYEDSIYLDNAISWLIEHCECVGHDIKKWKFLVAMNEYEYNISLSHGISGLILILCKCLSFKADERLPNIITGASNYLLSQEIDHNIYGSFFPSKSIDSTTISQRSRLGWCYGDLGVGLALWQAGKLLSNAQYKKKGLEVLLYSSKRRTIEQTSITDAGICHGTSGLVMIFDYLYKNTGENNFLSARDYWIEETLKMCPFTDGLAGYKAYQYNGEFLWNKTYDLLEGVAGIGLTLNSIVNPDQKLDEWAEIFLLNR